MAINTRSEYAIRALLEIADAADSTISAQRICELQALPKKYIERLLGNLKMAGIIASSPGSKGGYILAKSEQQITLNEILSAVEDDSLDPTCATGSHRFCPGGSCGLRGFFTELGNQLNRVISGYTLADIRRQWKGAI